MKNALKRKRNYRASGPGDIPAEQLEHVLSGSVQESKAHLMEIYRMNGKWTAHTYIKHT